MIVALFGPTQLSESLLGELREAGFAHLRVPACPPQLDQENARLFGPDYRVRLLRDSFEKVRNELVTGLLRMEELLALSRIAPTGLIDVGQRLSKGEADMLDAAHIPVHRLTGEGVTFASLRPALVDVARRLPRIGWDDYFMQIAGIVAARGDCVKRRVAAVIVKDRRIIATGYNGAPRGVKNCSEGGCPRCSQFAASGANLDECLCSHGEENAIIQAAYHGTSVKDAVLYTTCSPCLLCTKMIINAGIGEVVYNAAYPMAERSLELLRESGVRARQLTR
jgi:dCMP deaminase